MLMDLNGMILNESRSPGIDKLEAFLTEYPNFRPVLNTNKLGKPWIYFFICDFGF